VVRLRLPVRLLLLLLLLAEVLVYAVKLNEGAAHR
jgi:hypothetical protein